MPTTLGQVDIINMALSLIGVVPIVDLSDPGNPAVEQALLHWQPSLGILGRAAPWSCISKPAVLVQVAQDPLNPGNTIPVPAYWIPSGHAYAAGDYVQYGNPAYIYQALVANVSTASFVNDLTSGFWFQTDQFNPNPFGGSGQNYASSYAYKYALPEDCLFVAEYNPNACDGYEADFKIMGSWLYSNDAQVCIIYVWPDPDTTRYDTLFVECLSLKLAAKMATKLRQDDTAVAKGMESDYKLALGRARAKNANEKRSRRFDPVANSRFVAARRWSTNS